MKPNTEQRLRHEGNLGGQRREMTLDENSLAHLMTVLTDLYSDPVEAVIREYPINAADSHKAAGQTRPIEVELPTMTDPTFVVRDWGVGLSVDEVLNNFAKYGWSSKRETNAEVGMLGLGCKSALTYTSQFTLTAIQGGVKAEVLVSRGEDGVSGVEVIDTSSTDEPNGVAIRIPVNDIHTFNRKARTFFQYWSDPLLVDGKKPDPPHSDYDTIWLDDNVLLVENNLGARDVVVMGNIPYPVNDNHCLTRIPQGDGRVKALRYRAIVWVDVGSVDFTPSRESLHYTERTIETLTIARKFVWDRFHDVTQRDVDEAETHTEAIRRMAKWARAKNSSFRLADYTYRGVKPPERLTVKREGNGIPGWVYDPIADTANKMGDHRYHTLTDNAVDLIWIDGHPSKTLSRRQRNQLRGYFLGEGSTWTRGQRIAVTNDMKWWAGPWLDDAKIDWSKIEEVDPIPPDSSTPVKKTSNKRPEWRIMTTEGIRRRDSVPNKPRIAFASPVDARVSTTNAAARDRYMATDMLARRIKQPYEIVLIHPQSFNRFKREHPRALSVPEALIKEMKALKQRLTPLQQSAIWLALSSRTPDGVNLLARLDESRIKDPKLSNLIKDLHKIGDEKLTPMWGNLKRGALGYQLGEAMPELKGKRTEEVRRIAFQLGEAIPELESKHAEEIRRIIDGYPLLARLSMGKGAEYGHVEDYINGIYLLRQEEA